ncbi:YidC/Oxa1 family membrane protein insertase [Patescibacteria group bacterium]|nr:YidC/Oxa1 family membrane protein insertase [Patescibacteria group bacterium]
MAELFNTALYQPIFNALIFLYNVIPGDNIGIAIIVLTVLIKLILFPFSWKSIKSQRALQAIQPKMAELKKKFADQKEKLAAEMMKLYKTEKVSPFSSCLPLLIQLPFLFAVFRVFRDGFRDEALSMLYPFVNNPGHVNSWVYGVDLAQPNLILAILTGAVQFWQAKMMITTKQPKVAGAKDEAMLSAMNKQMVYFMPIFTVIIGMQLPAGLMVYWMTTTLLMVFQQYYIFGKDKHKDEKVEVIDQKPN